ncbi:MAG TPA: hypothetical protein DEQ61_20245 [Streptomyces sp.]|nr:hypothetical protein [Streptomyces sp.]
MHHMHAERQTDGKSASVRWHVLDAPGGHTALCGSSLTPDPGGSLPSSEHYCPGCIRALDKHLIQQKAVG